MQNIPAAPWDATFSMALLVVHEYEFLRICMTVVLDTLIKDHAWQRSLWARSCERPVVITA